MLGDNEAALRTCAEGLSLEPEDAELWFRKGMAHRRRAELDEAESAWRKILTLRRPEKFASVDQGIYGHVTRRNLAELRENAATARRRNACGGQYSPNARATGTALRNLNAEGM